MNPREVESSGRALDHWGVVSSLMNNVIKGTNLACPSPSSPPVQNMTVPTQATIFSLTTGEDLPDL